MFARGQGSIIPILIVKETGKSSTGNLLIINLRIQQPPSYKNLVIKEPVGSKNFSIQTPLYKNLLRLKMKIEAGSYLENTSRFIVHKEPGIKKGSRAGCVRYFLRM